MENGPVTFQVPYQQECFQQQNSNIIYINEERFSYICNKYEISYMFSQYLRQLVHFKITIIADDSGSMAMLTRFNESRWCELCKFINIVFAITETMENNLIDIHFLNRGSIHGVKELSTITNAFINEPSGPTPIVPVLRHIINEKIDYTIYKGRIIIIATDGEPTDDHSRSDIKRLKHVLLNERSPTDYVSFLACTDENESIDYLNKWDIEIPNVDVMDDYPNEKKEVLRAQGREFSFTFGDYVVKTILGSVFNELDKLDECKLYNATQFSSDYLTKCVDYKFEQSKLEKRNNPYKYNHLKDDSDNFNNDCRCLIL